MSSGKQIFGFNAKMIDFMNINYLESIKHLTLLSNISQYNYNINILDI